MGWLIFPILSCVDSIVCITGNAESLSRFVPTRSLHQSTARGRYRRTFQHHILTAGFTVARAVWGHLLPSS